MTNDWAVSWRLLHTWLMAVVRRRARDAVNASELIGAYGDCNLGAERFYDLVRKGSGVSDALLLIIARARPDVIRAGVFARVVGHRPQLCEPLLDVLERQGPPSVNPVTALDILIGCPNAPRQIFMRLMAMSAEALAYDEQKGAQLLLVICYNDVLYKMSAVLAAGVRPTVRTFERLLRKRPASAWASRTRAFFAHDHVYEAAVQLAFARIASQRLLGPDLEFVFGRIGLDPTSMSVDHRAQLVNCLLHNYQGVSDKLPLLDRLLDGVPLGAISMSFSDERAEPLLARRYLAGANQQIILDTPPVRGGYWMVGHVVKPQAFGCLLSHLPAGASVALLDLRAFGLRVRHLQWIVDAQRRAPIVRIRATPRQIEIFREMQPMREWTPGVHRQSPAAARAAIVTLVCLRARRCGALGALDMFLVFVLCARLHAQHNPFEPVGAQ
jgi:hypothetical protein